jgi:hypothetical protein
MLNLL